MLRTASSAASRGWVFPGRSLHSVASLRGRSLLKISDLSQDELKGLLQLSHELKALYREGGHAALPQTFAGQNISMIFQKRSTRTRLSTESGMAKLGGRAIFLGSEDIQLGVNETMLDTARVMSRFSDIIMARVFAHDDVAELAAEASVPVINALCDLYHPLQTLADYMTLQERFGTDLAGRSLVWVGDGSNVLHDLMLAAPALGVDVRVATPVGYEPADSVTQATKAFATEYGTQVQLCNDPRQAVTGAHVVVTDTWVSMGQEEEAALRIKDFEGYQVTPELMELAADDGVFLHCLPRHQEEVSDDVFYSSRSLVFDEAENRMWTVMAVMLSIANS